MKKMQTQILLYFLLFFILSPKLIIGEQLISPKKIRQIRKQEKKVQKFKKRLNRIKTKMIKPSRKNDFVAVLWATLIIGAIISIPFLLTSGIVLLQVLAWVIITILFLIILFTLLVILAMRNSQPPIKATKPK